MKQLSASHRAEHPDGPAPPEQDPDLRSAARMLPTGVTVVTGGRGSTVHAMTVNSFTTVSLGPPTVLFCLQDKARLYARIADTGAFTVNVLAGDQKDLARRFATSGRPDGPAGLGDVPLGRAPGGGLLIDGALGWFECRDARFVPAGDHLLVLGEVASCGVLRRAPALVFHNGGFSSAG
ncbi:flavin reductase [Kitasatospora herbaricolor]|uniref:flavin reductase family protein n=1 Tax=Kitasatospora herbaricolor TaxID=68217 RepID=UPI0019B476BC|nr:flavin reductase family protein [Kitasatospora herbaricolor]MDQ0309538.1 flavin reductase (DIM6/NTAB) family NADH-FMN oxidoreductase RutF [Kitasatospora herbaricolor]GGV01185.1 flavin reductase [Kitasatospora herbaricolor]